MTVAVRRAPRRAAAAAGRSPPDTLEHAKAGFGEHGWLGRSEVGAYHFVAQVAASARGDLVHADQHGAVVVPRCVAAKVHRELSERGLDTGRDDALYGWRSDLQRFSIAFFSSSVGVGCRSFSSTTRWSQSKALWYRTNSARSSGSSSSCWQRARS